MAEYIEYKGWTIEFTGMSTGGITTFVAKKEGVAGHIGATSIQYVKKIIDYEESNNNNK